MTKVQRFVRATGAFYIFLGVIGLFGALGGTASSTPNDLLGVLEVTVISNIIHLGVGAALWAATQTQATARTVSTFVGVVFLLIGILEVASIGSVADLIGSSVAGSVLHLTTAALALYFGRLHPSPVDGTV